MLSKAQKSMALKTKSILGSVDHTMMGGELAAKNADLTNMNKMMAGVKMLGNSMNWYKRSVKYVTLTAQCTIDNMCISNTM